MQPLLRLEVLADPQRRSLYELMIATAAPTTRQQLAEDAGIGPSLVGFHLEKLIEAGLVRAAGAVSTGSRGRPKVTYVAAAGEALMTVPPRRYELASRLLLEAAREVGGAGMLPALSKVARRYGITLASGHGGAGSRRASARRRLSELLVWVGYRPSRRHGGEIVLLNCPFDQLRQVDTELVCTMNLELTRGCIEGLGMTDQFNARLEPDPARCCVVLSERVSR